MADIYDQHKAAFASVSAHVILKDGVRVATVAFKYPRDGAGRLYAYVHVFGRAMVRGFASGGGYDKHSAACASAASHIRISSELPDAPGAMLCRDVLFNDDGMRWDNRLERAGFTVLQAV